jgi:hypothetical protein
MTEQAAVSTATADRPEIVRDLTADELRDWMPHLGSLAEGVRAVWVDLLRTPDWEPIPEGVRKLCRNPKCQEMGVAELRRTGRHNHVTWWAYDAAHLPGIWVPPAEGGTPPQLLARRLVGAPTPPEG